MKVGTSFAYWSCLAVMFAACGSPSPITGTGIAGKDGGAGTSGAAGAGSGGAGTSGAAGTGAGASGTSGAAGTGSADASAAGDARDGGDATANDGGAGADGGPAPEREVVHWGTSRDLDLLFMIDDSLSMKPLQNKLIANFPVFMNVLKGLPGGLPNLHLAVVSSDLGSGPYSAVDIPACRTGGDQGIFQSMPRGTTCGAGSLNAGERFIVDVGGAQNYTGDISAAFSCIAALGDTGCGFEHQFASVLRALGADGVGPPAENAGFLRPSALLAVVLVTNEDDCSAPPSSMLFDPGSRFVSDPLGPLASYRCNEFGHLCGGQRPTRTPPASGADLSGTCQSAEDGTLLKVADVAARLKSLKSDPSRVIVSAIAGPPNPYVVDAGPATLKDDPNQLWPQIRHSCQQQVSTGALPEYADPGVRINQWVQAFGAKGTFQSICNDSFQPALQTIANSVGSGVDVACLDAKLLDTDAVAAGVQPDCAFVDHTTTAQGMRVDTPLPACAQNGGVAPCWSVTADARCGANGLVTLERAAGASGDVTTTATCQLCGANDARPGCAP